MYFMDLINNPSILHFIFFLGHGWQISEGLISEEYDITNDPGTYGNIPVRDINKRSKLPHFHTANSA